MYVHMWVGFNVCTFYSCAYVATCVHCTHHTIGATAEHSHFPSAG